MFHLPLAPGVELRPLEPRHSDELFALVDRNRDRLRKWLPWVDGAKSAEDTAKFIRDSLKRHAETGEVVAGIWYRGKLAGTIGLHIRGEARAMLGYWLSEEAEGKGLMTLACRAMLAHAFRDLGAERVEIFAEPRNRRSRAIPQRLGFRREGTLRHVAKLDGRFIDHEVYSLLREEWATT
ncbi:MAG: GNAT family N-acetyltransferase [Planctomycetes bacterium]|nr:GNAT family N-acetyltransferase [Planctomycetota bacterium]